MIKYDVNTPTNKKKKQIQKVTQSLELDGKRDK